MPSIAEIVINLKSSIQSMNYPKGDKFIKTAKILTLLKSNSTSISISNRDVAHETLPTSRFEIEIEIEVEFDFKKKTKCQPN